MAAIKAIAYLLEDNINDMVSSLITVTITDKLVSQLNPLTTELSAMKSFLEVTSAQQATLSLNLQEVATQHAATSLNLVKMSTKLTTPQLLVPTHPQPSSPPPSWPSLLSSLPPYLFTILKI